LWLSLRAGGSGPGEVPPGMRAALAGLAPPGAPRAALAEQVLAAGGPDDLPALDELLTRLDRDALLDHRITVGGREFPPLHPLTPGRGPEPAAVPGDRPGRISRFAYWRRQGASG